MNPEESPAPESGPEVTPPTYSELRERRRSFREYQDNLLAQVALEFVYTSPLYDPYSDGDDPGRSED